jgi:hypothetical protein
MPLSTTKLLPLQRLVDACLTAALHLPRSAPKAVLQTPVSHGGFRFPQISTRCDLRFVSSTFSAACSRNSLVSRNICHLLLHPSQLGPPPNDATKFLELCAQWDLAPVFSADRLPLRPCPPPSICRGTSSAHVRWLGSQRLGG